MSPTTDADTVPDMAPDTVPDSDPLERLTPLLRGRVADRLGWLDLRTAQKLAIAPILDGHNTLVLAPTAGGKTEAAFLPLLSALYDERALPLSVLYLSPLKALLNNQEARLARLSDMVGRTVFRWHGDVAEAAKDGFMRAPADLLMITPESLEGLLLAGCDRLFGNLRAVVVDEAHAFAGTERGDHLASLLERVAAISRHDLQRIGLSATVGNPAALLEWLSGASKRPQSVVDPPRSGVKRYFTLKFVEGLHEPASDDATGEAPGLPSQRDVSKGECSAGHASSGSAARSTPGRTSQQEAAEAIAEVAAPYLAGKSTMFFADARRLTEALRPALVKHGLAVKVHHASIDRKLREEAEQGIQREPCCLLCTSTMELGVDVGDLDAVLQLDAPTTVASFLQRMGRSGRRGVPGHMVVLADDPEGFLRAIALTELARRRWVEPVQLTRRAWGPYVHQILALVVARGPIEASACYEALSRSWAFSDIRQRDFEELVDHLCAQNLLERARHRIQLGYAAEQEFGDRGFASLCAVFDGGAPQLEVTAGGEAIGSLDRSFASRLQRGATFNLAGRTWQAGSLDLQRGRLEVTSGEAMGAALPSWRGAPGTPMAAEVAREIRAILEGRSVPEYLDPPEQDKLAELRDAAADAGLVPRMLPIETRSGRLIFWTLAGERINRVLAKALALELGCESSETWSRFTLRPAKGAAGGSRGHAGDSRAPGSLEDFDQDGKGPKGRGKKKWGLDLDQAIAAWQRLEAWGLSKSDRQRILAALPDRTGSRFLRYLPEPFAHEVKAAALVDFDGAVAFASQHRATSGSAVLPSPGRANPSQS